MAESSWYPVDPGPIEVDRIATVVVAGRAVCITRTADGYGALDNRCPHQGGPLGDGQIENGYVTCPWHGYEYNPCSGMPPERFSDAATSYAIEERDGGLFVELPVPEERVSLMDPVVDVLTAWGSSPRRSGRRRRPAGCTRPRSSLRSRRPSRATR